VTLLRNLALYFVVFLPAALLTGWVFGFFTGPRSSPRLAYELLRFTFEVLPLLLPSLLMVVVLHFAYRRWLGDGRNGKTVALVALTTPAALLAAHLAAYGIQYWSVPLAVLFALPGALFGTLMRR